MPRGTANKIAPPRPASRIRPGLASPSPNDRPLNRGARFSCNAAMPSFKSSLCRTRASAILVDTVRSTGPGGTISFTNRFNVSMPSGAAFSRFRRTDGASVRTRIAPKFPYLVTQPVSSERRCSASHWKSDRTRINYGLYKQKSLRHHSGAQSQWVGNATDVARPCWAGAYHRFFGPGDVAVAGRSDEALRRR